MIVSLLEVIMINYKNILLGCSFSLVTVLAFCGGQHLSEDPSEAVAGLDWPVAFESHAVSVEASFPIPPKRIGHVSPSDRLYVAQGQDKDGGMRTFSLSYQAQPLVQADSANEALRNFLELLKSQANVQVTELDIDHKSHRDDDAFAALEVSDRERTDIYLVRVVQKGAGQIIAIHTVEKGEESPDIESKALWAFPDSVRVSP